MGWGLCGDKTRILINQRLRGDNLMSKKAFLILGALFLTAVLLTPAAAEMYVEAYLGGAKSAPLSQTVTLNSATIPGQAGIRVNGETNPSVLGGVKLGYWFVPTGFLGYNYPDWMKYFGVYTDFSFQRLNLRHTAVGARTGIWNQAFGPVIVPGTLSSEGTVATWAFMLAARYGFLPDSEVPFGRLQPYVGVGPALIFASQELAFNARPGFNGSANVLQLGLMAEVGLRYMALKNVSLDLSFRYRYGDSPNYHLTGSNGIGEIDYSPTTHLFSIQLGAAYHF
jgi:opacity protein-like surface antigen